MPKGVYKKSPEHIAKIVKNLEGGRTPEVRKKVAKILKKNASSKEWRQMIGRKTKEALRRPETRKRHLAGIKRAIEEHGVGFKGGNGQPLTRTIRIISKILEPQGFIREYVIPTKGQSSKYTRPPDNYKADFAHPLFRFVLEIDGPAHRTSKARRKEKKKTAILESLGWTVMRILHD